MCVLCIADKKGSRGNHPCRERDNKYTCSGQDKVKCVHSTELLLFYEPLTKRIRERLGKAGRIFHESRSTTRQIHSTHMDQEARESFEYFTKWCPCAILAASGHYFGTSVARQYFIFKTEKLWNKIPKRNKKHGKLTFLFSTTAMWLRTKADVMRKRPCWVPLRLYAYKGLLMVAT